MGDPDPNSVKARLLPPTPVEMWLERMVEKLRRSRIDVALVPANDIDVVDEQRGEYKARGSQPWFELSLALASIRGRWIYLEAALVRNNGSRIANLYLDVDSGQTENFSWPITTNMRGSVREVVYVPSNAVRLRWQPTAAPGFFSQSPLLVHAIGALESVLRRGYRISTLPGRGRSHEARRHKRLDWSSLPVRFQAAYRLTAELRLRQARGNDYAAFLDRTERLSRSESREIRVNFARKSARHSVAIVICLESPNAELLGQAIESVRSQWYPHWHLLIVGNASMAAGVNDVLEQHRCADERIFVFLDLAYAEVVSSYQRALAMASDDFTMRLGQHDLLSQRALGFIAAKLDTHPQVDVVYSDHDRVDVAGARFAPEFKPDWNPDLLLSQNYVGPLVVFRTRHLLAFLGYRHGFDGAEGYDLLLRLVKSKADLQILHVPKVLYSIRQMPHASVQRPFSGRCSGFLSEGLAGLRALQEHVASLGAEVSQISGTACYRVRYPLPPSAPLVSLVIPTRDKSVLLRACVESIRERTTYPNWELLVIDNGSVESDSLAYLDGLGNDPRISVVRYAGPFNYSAINNYAVRMARGTIVGLVNNDVEVISPEWLSEMVSHSLRPGIGAVGAKLLYENGTVQHAGVILGIGGVAGHAHKFLDQDSPGYGCRAISIQNMTAVTGACLVVRKAIYLEVGGLNESDLKIAMNDVDFCIRLVERGYRNVFTPFAKLYHHESMSRGRDDTVEKQRQLLSETNYMKLKWGQKLLVDPAYNPNLTLQFEDFTY